MTNAGVTGTLGQREEEIMSKEKDTAAAYADSELIGVAAAYHRIICHNMAEADERADKIMDGALELSDWIEALLATTFGGLAAKLRVALDELLPPGDPSDEVSRRVLVAAFVDATRLAEAEMRPEHAMVAAALGRAKADPAPGAADHDGRLTADGGAAGGERRSPAKRAPRRRKAA